MHNMFFSVKRAFRSTVRACDRITRHFGLTPARFDVMFVVYGARHSRLTQREIRMKLGVSRTTVCRMVRALEQLGFLSRSRDEVDRRTRLVRITEKGYSLFRRATHRVIDSGAAAFMAETAMTGPRYPERGFQNMLRFDNLIQHLRQQFFDTATLYYPWHPDD